MIVFPCLFSFLVSAQEYLVKVNDYRVSQLRLFSVQTLLRYPLFYCGHGLSVNSEEYKKSFGNSRFQPFNWDGPVSVIKSSTGTENTELRIVYSKCEYVKLKNNFTYKKDGEVISLSKPLEKNSIMPITSATINNIRNCIVFRSSFPGNNPLIVRWASGDQTRLEIESFANKEHFTLYKNDTLYLLAAMRVFVKNGILYTNDLKTSGDQPRINGIEDLRFFINDDKTLLTAYILSRGDYRYSENKNIIGIEKCDLNLANEWKYKKSNYQLYVNKLVWRLPNCISENFFNGKEIVEL